MEKRTALLHALVISASLSGCDTGSATGGGGESSAGGCEGRDEASCSGACTPVYGNPFPEGGQGDYTDHAGCRAVGDEGCTEAQACGRSPAPDRACWDLRDGCVPDGWEQVSDVDVCANLPECSE